MKKIILIYLFIFTTIFPSDDIGSYKAFMQAKNHYLDGKFDQAKIEFENFIENYRNSKLVNSHYPDYYIAMNYYKIGEFKNALKYLETSIYTPKYLKNLGYKRLNYFEFRRGFYLGKIYSDLGYSDHAEHQYLTLIKDYYSLDLEPFDNRDVTLHL